MRDLPDYDDIEAPSKICPIRTGRLGTMPCSGNACMLWLPTSTARGRCGLMIEPPVYYITPTTELTTELTAKRPDAKSKTKSKTKAGD